MWHEFNNFISGCESYVIRNTFKCHRHTEFEERKKHVYADSCLLCSVAEREREREREREEGGRDNV